MSKRLVYDEPAKFYAYRNAERLAFLLPLMHSENAKDVKACADWCQKLSELNVKQGNQAYADQYLSIKKFAEDHQVPIDRFGRYPTRNKALGRTNTADEEEFLKTADRYGQ